MLKHYSYLHLMPYYISLKLHFNVISFHESLCIIRVTQLKGLVMNILIANHSAYERAYIIRLISALELENHIYRQATHGYEILDIIKYKPYRSHNYRSRTALFRWY